MSVYDSDHKNLANKIKHIRLSNNLSQVDVAKRLQKTQSYISKIESGQVKLDVIILKKICEIYKVPISKLMET